MEEALLIEASTDSFTETYRKAARALQNRNGVSQNMTEYGQFVFDGAVLGGSCLVINGVISPPIKVISTVTQP